MITGVALSTDHGRYWGKKHNACTPRIKVAAIAGYLFYGEPPGSDDNGNDEEVGQRWSGHAIIIFY